MPEYLKSRWGLSRTENWINRASQYTNQSVLKGMRNVGWNPGGKGWRMADYFGSTMTGVVRDGLKEGLTEWAQSVSDDIIDEVGYKDGINSLNEIADIMSTDEAVQGFWGGVVGGSSMG